MWPLCFVFSFISYFFSFLRITNSESTVVCQFSKVSQFSPISQYSQVRFSQVNSVIYSDSSVSLISQLSSSVQSVSSVKSVCQSVSTTEHASWQLVRHLGSQTVVLFLYLKYHLQIVDWFSDVNLRVVISVSFSIN